MDAVAVIPARVETARLCLRDWQQDLSDPAARAALEADLAGVLSDRVLAPLPDSLRPEAGISHWIAARQAESQVYLVQVQGALAGLILLAQSSVREAHLGYLFGEAHWGKGYASESVLGLLSALKNSGLRVIWAGVGRDNPASARVLEKAGFVQDTAQSGPDTIQYRYDFEG